MRNSEIASLELILEHCPKLTKACLGDTCYCCWSNQFDISKLKIDKDVLDCGNV